MSSTTSTIVVGRRPVTDGDNDVVRGLFEQSRDDLALLPPELVDVQFRAQRAQVMRDYPAATYELLTMAGAAAGLLVLAADHAVVRVVDIVVARSHRRQGVAEAVMRDVITQAGDRPVRLTVWAANQPARALYERLGFMALADSQTHIPMERRPDAESRSV